MSAEESRRAGTLTLLVGSITGEALGGKPTIRHLKAAGVCPILWAVPSFSGHTHLHLTVCPGGGRWRDSVTISDTEDPAHRAHPSVQRQPVQGTLFYGNGHDWIAGAQVVSVTTWAEVWHDSFFLGSSAGRKITNRNVGV